MNFTNKISTIFRELKKIFIIRTNDEFLESINSFSQRFEELFHIHSYETSETSSKIGTKSELIKILGKAKSNFHLFYAKLSTCL